MKTIIRLVLVVLLLPKKVAELIVAARFILTSMTGNTRFPNPNPPLATLGALIDDVERAETACKSRAKDTAEARNQRVRALKAGLKTLATYVQNVADANPDEAEALIRSAGMKAKRIASRHKADLEVKHGKVSGEVVLIAASAGHSAEYEWQYSTDQKTWTDVRHTMQARTTVRGLTPGTTYWFRYRALTRRVDGDWHEPVSLIVT